MPAEYVKHLRVTKSDRAACDAEARSRRCFNTDRVVSRLRFAVVSYTAESPRSDTGQFPETARSLKETLMDHSSHRRPLWTLANVLGLDTGGTWRPANRTILKGS